MGSWSSRCAVLLVGPGEGRRGGEGSKLHEKALRRVWGKALCIMVGGKRKEHAGGESALSSTLAPGVQQTSHSSTPYHFLPVLATLKLAVGALGRLDGACSVYLDGFKRVLKGWPILERKNACSHYSLYHFASFLDRGGTELAGINGVSNKAIDSTQRKIIQFDRG